MSIPGSRCFVKESFLFLRSSCLQKCAKENKPVCFSILLFHSTFSGLRWWWYVCMFKRGPLLSSSCVPPPSSPLFYPGYALFSWYAVVLLDLSSLSGLTCSVKAWPSVDWNKDLFSNTSRVMSHCFMNQPFSCAAIIIHLCIFAVLLL